MCLTFVAFSDTISNAFFKLAFARIPILFIGFAPTFSSLLVTLLTMFLGLHLQGMENVSLGEFGNVFNESKLSIKVFITK